jgi:5-methylcytosine-specific restriction endonuclease McrA
MINIEDGQFPYFFHVIENGTMEMQGMITGKCDEWYSVCYFSWVTGHPSGEEKLYTKEKMNNWRFYSNNKEMVDAYTKAHPGEYEDDMGFTRPQNNNSVKRLHGKSKRIMRFNILKRDAYKCQICGKTAQDGARLEIDHKHPKSKGGLDTEDNLWTLCFECNRGKLVELL